MSLHKFDWPKDRYNVFKWSIMESKVDLEEDERRAYAGDTERSGRPNESIGTVQ